MNGGSVSDVFSNNIKSGELRETIWQEVNNNRAKYGFHISHASGISCDGSLKRYAGATQTCTARAERNFLGIIEGEVRFTVTLSSTGSESVQPVVNISNIRETN